MRQATRQIVAVCIDCPWRDEKPGALGRAARHHDRTGHQVTTHATTTYTRTGPPAGQTSIDEIEVPA